MSLGALNDYKIGTCDISMSEMATWPRAGNPGRFEFLGKATLLHAGRFTVVRRKLGMPQVF